ncbi:M24 family metallopeptidase [Solicola sp. PLA-1-18]|uniref:M24 family metallopeptidase n=1 Tax=Solicola sp. PLA-1-18 TaxID=3380532 RepID=UPI003B7BE9C9
MTSDTADRLRRAQQTAADQGVDALLVSPGPDLRYLTGYDAKPLERLTCLVLPSSGTPVLVAPHLERAAAVASGVEALGVEIVTWQETHDPYALTATLVKGGVVGLDNHMWAEKVLALAHAMPGVEQRLAGPVLRELRMRKTPQEVDALREAGAAIDRVHARMGEWLRPGRTEREVGADIADAILAEGHATVDFVIVGSGPNGASPHHEVSDRVIEAGDPVVVDIGGTTPAGYCSDCTRNYVAGGTPSAEYEKAFAVLREAQQVQCDYARPGVTAESVDAVGRRVIADAGYGDLFIHRTGHGIGLETHEEPYIVEGNDIVLEPGMAFSIEPGIYLEGRHGARIEDIVVCTDDGLERLNLTTRDVVTLP